MNTCNPFSISHLLFLLIIMAGPLFCTAETVKIESKKNQHEFNVKPIDTPKMLLADQSQDRIVIVDINKNRITWEWKPEYTKIKKQYYKWFSNLSEVKPVYGNQYLLITASGGGVALIRIADKRVLFYAYAGGNTHSAEILPDGNIVTASSTGGYLTIFKTDTVNFPENVRSVKIPFKFAHNVTWDKKGQLLWSASMNHLVSFSYNFDCNNPDLTKKDSISLSGTEAHDVYPIYGQNALWVTNTTSVFQYNLDTQKLTKPEFSSKDVKSISSGPGQTPIAVIKPIEKWWTDRVLSSDNKIIFQQAGLKIYKARWLLPNVFSYGDSSGKIIICK